MGDDQELKCVVQHHRQKKNGGTRRIRKNDARHHGAVDKRFFTTAKPDTDFIPPVKVQQLTQIAADTVNRSKQQYDQDAEQE